jgi:hypothetical protein
MNKNAMYVIQWRDHFSTDGFYSKDLEEFDDKSLIFKSLGFYIKEDEHYYHFARTIGEADCADIMSIIKEQIIEIDEIEDNL